MNIPEKKESSRVQRRTLKLQRQKVKCIAPHQRDSARTIWGKELHGARFPKDCIKTVMPTFPFDLVWGNIM